MKDKAKAQGLTPDDARKAWSDATTKAKTVADAARDSLQSNTQR